MTDFWPIVMGVIGFCYCIARSFNVVIHRDDWLARTMLWIIAAIVSGAAGFFVAELLDKRP